MKRVTLPAKRIKRIHVARQVIASNLKHGRNDPPITVQHTGGPTHGYKVKIKGPSTFIYRPDDPLSCGARLWVETLAEVEVIQSATQSIA